SAAVAQIVDLQFAGVGLFLLRLPGGAGGLGLFAQDVALLTLELPILIQLNEAAFACFLVLVPGRLRRGRLQHGALALGHAGPRVLKLLFALHAFLPALLQIGLDLAMLGAQRGEALRHLGETDLGGRAALLMELALPLAFAYLLIRLLQAGLQQADLLLGLLGLGAGLPPGVLQVLDLLFHAADLTAAERHFLMQAVAALTVLAEPPAHVGRLLR